MKSSSVTTIVAIAIGLAVATYVVPLTLGGFKHTRINQGLVAACVQINKECPKAIDEYTRLDSAFSGEMEITYHYTVLNLADEDVMKAKDNIIKVNTETVMTKPETRRLIDQGVTMRYVYQNAKGAKLFDFQVRQ
jgi:hypothetical protein